MVNKWVRQFSEEEKQKLQSVYPSVFALKKRKNAKQELDVGVVEVLEFKIDRVWNMNGCSPPCCPYSYFFKIDDNEFVYIESWHLSEEFKSEFLKREMRIALSLFTKRLVSIDMYGRGVPIERVANDLVSDYLNLPYNEECRVFYKSELPEEVLNWMIGVT
jgi:hypothetical protein